MMQIIIIIMIIIVITLINIKNNCEDEVFTANEHIDNSTDFKLQ